LKTALAGESREATQTLSIAAAGRGGLGNPAFFAWDAEAKAPSNAAASSASSALDSGFRVKVDGGHR